MFRSLVPHVALILAMLTWSTSFIALKLALSAYSPLTVMAGRMLIASAICLPMLKAVLAAMRHAPTRRALVICVLCEPCFYFLFETFALRYTSSSQAGMVIALLPLTVAAGAWLLLKDRLSARTWLGFALAVIGVIWLTLGSSATESAPYPLLGNMLEVGAMICATGYTLCIQRLADRLTPIQLSGAMSFAGALFFVPLALLPLPIEPIALAVAAPDWMPPAAVVYLGTVVTFGGYGLYNLGVSRLSAARSAGYLNLIPVLTLFMGVLWLRDSLAPAQYLASGLVVAGIMLGAAAKKA